VCEHVDAGQGMGSVCCTIGSQKLNLEKRAQPLAGLNFQRAC